MVVRWFGTLAKTNESFELFNGDVTENYFLFSNPHEFGKAIDIRMTPIRVVCNNTLTLSLSQDSNAMVKVNHRKEFDSAEVKEQMGIAKEKMEQYKNNGEFLGSKRYTSENIIQYFNEVFGSPAKEKVDNVLPFTSNNAKDCYGKLGYTTTWCKLCSRFILERLQYCHLHDRPHSRSFK